MSRAGAVAIEGHGGPWTVADVLDDLPVDGSRHEILAPGVLTVSPGPATLHQRVAMRLARLLDDAALASGAEVEVLEAVNVVTGDERLVVPDVVVVDGAAAACNPITYEAARVWLAVEIVSPSSRATDRLIKPELYAAAGVRLMWRVEPEQQLLAVVADGRQVEAHTGAFALAEPFPLQIDLHEVARPRHG